MKMTNEIINQLKEIESLRKNILQASSVDAAV
jgi:hypothetical protein